MKIIFLLSVLIPFSFFAQVNKIQNNAQNVTQNESYEGIVVLQLSDVSNETFNKVERYFLSKRNANLEYSCMKSSIVVIKFYNNNFSSKADNAMQIKNQILSIDNKIKVDVVFVDVYQSTASSKC